jgi:hypothetical protein
MFFGSEENTKVLAEFLRKSGAAHIDDESSLIRYLSQENNWLYLQIT